MIKPYNPGTWRPHADSNLAERPQISVIDQSPSIKKYPAGPIQAPSQINPLVLQPDRKRAVTQHKPTSSSEIPLNQPKPHLTAAWLLHSTYDRNIQAYLKNEFFRTFNVPSCLGYQPNYLKGSDYYFPSMEINPQACRDADRVIWFSKDSYPTPFYETFVDSPAGEQLLHKHNLKLQSFRKKLETYNWNKD